MDTSFQKAQTVIYWIDQIRQNGRAVLSRMNEDIFWHVLNIVAEESHIGIDKILAPGKKDSVVRARFLVVILLREYTHNTFAEIAAYVYGNKDRHDNAHFACHKAADRIGRLAYEDYTRLYLRCVERITYPQRRIIAEVAQ